MKNASTSFMMMTGHESEGGGFRSAVKFHANALLEAVVVSPRFESRSSRFAGPLLATAAVLLMGAIAVCIVIALGGGDPIASLLVFVACLGGTLFLGVLLKTTSTLDSRFSWVRSKEARPENEYSPEAVRQRRRYGTNLPPSVDEVRDLKDGLRNWVPSNTGKRSSAPGKRLRGEE